MENRKYNQEFLGLKSIPGRQLLSFIIIGITFLVIRLYLPLLDAKFFLDDYLHLMIVKENINFLNAFTKDFMLGAFYRPILYFVWKINFIFFNINPKSYYMINIIILIANSILLLFIMNLLKINKFISFFAVCIWIVNPITATGTVWLSSRYDLVSTFFLLSSILLYILFHLSGKWKFYILSLFFALLSYFSKESCLSLPFLILAFYLKIEKKSGLKDKLTGLIILIIPYILLALLFMFIRLEVLGNWGGYNFTGQIALSNYRLIAGYFLKPLSTKIILVSYLLLIILLIKNKLNSTSMVSFIWIFASLLPVIPLYKLLFIPGMLLFLPYRFFFLTGIGMAFLVCSLLEQLNRKNRISGVLALSILLSLFVLKMYKSRQIINDWKKETIKVHETSADFFQEFNKRDYQDNSIFISTSGSLGIELDLRMKTDYKERTLKHLFVQEKGINYISLDEAQYSSIDEKMPWVSYFRNNPVKINNRIIGIIDTDESYWKNFSSSIYKVKLKKNIEIKGI